MQNPSPFHFLRPCAALRLRAPPPTFIAPAAARRRGMRLCLKGSSMVGENAAHLHRRLLNICNPFAA